MAKRLRGSLTDRDRPETAWAPALDAELARLRIDCEAGRCGPASTSWHGRRRLQDAPDQAPRPLVANLQDAQVELQAELDRRVRTRGPACGAAGIGAVRRRAGTGRARCWRRQAGNWRAAALPGGEIPRRPPEPVLPRRPRPRLAPTITDPAIADAATALPPTAARRSRFRCLSPDAWFDGIPPSRRWTRRAQRIVIPTWGKTGYTARCLRSLMACGDAASFSAGAGRRLGRSAIAALRGCRT